jgi:hypothetical protein
MIGRQNNCGGNHITRQRPASYFVDASKKLDIGWGVPRLHRFDSFIV